VPECEPGGLRDLGLNLLNEVADFPDCASGCANRYDALPFDIELPEDQVGTEILVSGARYDGVSGTIDGGRHAPGDFPDWDFLRIRAAPRTLIEVTVEPLYDPSCLDPLVSLFEPDVASAEPFFGLVRQNDARAAGERAARLLVVAPLPETEPWFVVVDDARNASGGSVGADSFRYLARFKRLGMAEFKEIPLPAPGEITSVDGELTEAGDVAVYTFHDPTLRSHTVRFITANRKMCGEIWQLNTKNGRASWTSSGASAVAPEGCALELEFRTNALVAGDDGEYGLAVTEALGRGSNSGAGPFAYTVELVSQP